ncbi:MAG: signal recognition particle-docking protein FtsY [Myxococcota bacterium]
MDSWIVWVVVALVAVAVAGFFVLRRRPSLPAPPEAPAIAPAPTNRLLAALQRTRDAFAAVFAREEVDAATLEQLEEALIRADVGAKASARMVEALRASPGASPDDLRRQLRDLVKGRLTALPTALATGGSPLVVLVVGVNGSGKTTTIGKLAARYRREGKTVVLGAGDTFRAGAIEQLKIWGERAEVPVVAHQEGADPGAVCHDTLQSALAKGIDVVILDTAGRLQAQKALMDELGKVRRVVGKVVPGAPHETLLVVDATMGQNALSQARVFREVAGVTGVVLTKLDGTAKGGVVIAIAEEFGLPVKLVGVGEKIDDLRDFDPSAFADALFPDAR